MSRWIAPILAAFVATGAVAQTSDSSDPIQTQDGIRYACTGVGASSREDPRWQAFAAKLVFAAKNGGYLHDVTTRVTNAEGKTVFTTTCGPWLLLDLRAGRYDVTATARDDSGQGHDSRATLSVGGGKQTETIIRFPGVPG